MAKPNLVVVKLPGLSGGRGAQGADGISAVNNIVNPILSDNQEFRFKTDIETLGYQMSPSITLTFEATLVLKGLSGTTAVVYVEGPEDSMVSGVMTYPYSAAPQPSGNSVSFGITSVSEDDYYVVKLAGSVRNSNNSGRVSIFIENLDEQPGGYIAAGSFVQWSIPIFTVIGGGNTSNPGTGGGLSKEQADMIYASRTDTRLNDKRLPLEQSVNANTIAPGGLPISSIDQLREELNIRVKTINGTSPDSVGNINVSSGGVAGITESQADQRYAKLTDLRFTDQRVPMDNSVVNIKVPNEALEVGKVAGLKSLLDAYTAQIANLTYRLQQIEQNGATPGGGTVGSGYAAVYPATY